MSGTPPHWGWRLFWRLLSPLALLLFKLLGKFFPKLNEAVDGRTHETWSGAPRGAVLFHCASVGEYEAARPVIEMLRSRGLQCVLTASSPSLYNRLKHSSNQEEFCYWAPIDIPREVRKMLNALQPIALVITKHDIWPEMVWQCRERKIPAILQSANFRTDSKRTWVIVRKFQRSLFGALSGIGAISSEDGERFSNLIRNRTIVRTTGDTRYDRVLAGASRPDHREAKLREWMESALHIIVGSSWKPDEELLLPVLQKLREQGIRYRLTIVPHESGEERIAYTIERLSQFGMPHLIYSGGLEKLDDDSVLIIDVQGLLSQLYRGAAIAWVGGGFGVGVHSVLEPAVYGLPVFFGPNITMSREARILASRGSGIVVKDDRKWEVELEKLLVDTAYRASIGAISSQLVKEESGATKQVADWVEELTR